MNKKILALLVFVVIASMSTAFAFDLNNVSNALSSDNSTNTTVTISNIKFKIPEGFKEVSNETIKNEPSDNPYLNYTESSKTYANASGAGIIIDVTTSDLKANDSFAEAASLGGNKTTINGVSGYTYSDPGFEGFSFAKDGHLVIISTTNKQLINDVVMA